MIVTGEFIYLRGQVRRETSDGKAAAVRDGAHIHQEDHMRQRSNRKAARPENLFTKKTNRRGKRNRSQRKGVTAVAKGLWS